MEGCNSKLNIALEYARRGFKIFPTAQGSKIPIAGLKWGAEATGDREQISKWYKDHPEYEIAIVTGARSGIAVVDIDTPEALEFVESNGLPSCPMVKTHKGYHLYCKYEDGVRNFQKRKDLPGIDLRGEGGYVVAPPSVHEEGTIYSWVEGKSLDDVELGKLPEYVLARDVSEKQSVSELLEGVAKGERNNALTRIVGSLISKGFEYDAIVAEVLMWNQKNDPPEENLTEVIATVKSIWNTEHAKSNDSWEDPILDDIIETPEITTDLLPSWFGRYAAEVTKENQTPEDLAVMAGLAVISTALQKRFEVQTVSNAHKETLSLWTVTIMGPSERKSPVLNAMTAPLHDWQQEQKQLLQDAYYQNRTERDVTSRRIEKLKADASKCDDPDQRAEYIQKAVELEREMPDELNFPKLWTGDVTPEQLQDLLAINGERMSVISDEGVIFGILTGLYSGGKSIVNIDIFLKAYTGSPESIERRSRAVTLNRPALSFGLTVQPQVIENLGNGKNNALRDKGLLARFLYCIPKSKLGSRDANQIYTMPQEVKDAYTAGVKRLLNVTPQLDGNNVEIPRMLTLALDALKAFQEFASEVERRIGPTGDLHSLADWGGKLAGNALRIAAILNLVEHGTNVFVVTKDNVDKSIDLCKRLIVHAKKAFGIIGNDPDVIASKKVYDWIICNNLTEFSKTKCLRDLHGSFKRAAELDKALSVLQERHILRFRKKPTRGRSIESFLLNKKLCK